MASAVQGAGSAPTAAATPAAAPVRHRARRSDSVRNAALVSRAAIELFAAHGMDVTLAQVADRAGVGKATVYRTYASREEMVAAMLAHRLAWLRQRIEAAVAGRDAWSEFAAMSRDVLAQMHEDHLLRYVLAPERPTGAVAESWPAPFGLRTRHSSRRPRRRGGFVPTSPDTDVAMLTAGLAAALSRSPGLHRGVLAPGGRSCARRLRHLSA